MFGSSSLRIAKLTEVGPLVFTCSYMFLHVLTCFYMFLHVLTCFYMFLHVFKRTCFGRFLHGLDLEQRLELVGQGVSFSKPGCLVSFVGVERVLGAPFRVIDEVTRSGDADRKWLRARVGEQTQEVMCLYAHLGLESVDALLLEPLDGPSKLDRGLPELHEPQIQSLITSYCLGSKLAHLGRMLPPDVLRDYLKKLGRLQVQVLVTKRPETRKNKSKEQNKSKRRLRKRRKKAS